jgi:hypothetical protein
MASRIAGGGPAASRSAMFGQALGAVGGGLAGQEFGRRREMSQLDPFRQALGQELGDQPGQTPAQRILQAAQQDPETFRRMFAEQGVSGIMQMMQPEGAAAPVAVSAGAHLVDPQTGEPIFSAPFKPEGPGGPMRGRPGDVFFDPQTGEQMFSVPESPGSVTPSTALGKLRQDFAAGHITREEFGRERERLLAMGEDQQLVQVADETASTGVRFVPRSEAAGREAPGGRDPVREQRIRDYMDHYGLPRGDAVALADGIKRIEIVPQTGRARLIDTRDESVREIRIDGAAPVGGEAVATDQPVEFQMPEGGTLWDMAGVATGPGAAFRRAISVPSGLMGLPVAEQTIRAQQAFSQTGQELIRSLAVNPRFPVGEMERIREEIATLPKFFDNEEIMRVRLAELDRGLRRRMQQAEKDAEDSRLPDNERNAQMTNARNIRAFLPVLGVPQTPEGVPPGSVRTGEQTRQGGIVWEAPDGTRWVEE